MNPVGIERAYNHILSGKDGINLKRKIAQGVWIPQDSDGNILPKAGDDIVTTINIDMQDVAEKSLERTLISEDADWGCVVLMKVNTGEIKVIANLKKDTLNRVREHFNYAMAEHGAPGSTFKLASLIAGLEDGKFEVTDSVDLQRGRVEYYDRVMIDSPHKYTKVTVAKAFTISSSVGISRIINKSYKNNPVEFTDRIYKMGLSTALDLELPYPNGLRMPSPSESGWSGVTLPWMSTGYEMALTPLHILTFYNAIANGGKMMNPIFTTSVISDGKEIIKKYPQVISPAICSRSTIDKIMPLLIEVTEQGTARNIKSYKYKIAGKTGTTVLNYAGRKNDEDKMYQASFAGFFPADNPKYSCIVVINNPKKGRVYGGQIAAPIFKELSDKVFALDMEIHNPITLSKEVKSFPVVKNRRFEEEGFILKSLGLTTNQITQKKMISNSLENRIVNELERGVMPDLQGLVLEDALFYLDKYFDVKIIGSGYIIKQSIKTGREFIKGSIIRLELA